MFQPFQSSHFKEFNMRLKAFWEQFLYTIITGIWCHSSWHPSRANFQPNLCLRVANISQQHTLPRSVAFFAHRTDPFRNSAETTEACSDLRCSVDLSLHVDLLASSLWFWSPSPSSSAPRRVSALAEEASRGLQGAFSILHPGLSVQRPWPVTRLHTHTHANF